MASFVAYFRMRRAEKHAADYLVMNLTPRRNLMPQASMRNDLYRAANPGIVILRYTSIRQFDMFLLLYCIDPAANLNRHDFTNWGPNEIILWMRSLWPDNRFSMYEQEVSVFLRNAGLTGQDMLYWQHESLTAMGIRDFEMRIRMMAQVEMLRHGSPQRGKDYGIIQRGVSMLPDELLPGFEE